MLTVSDPSVCSTIASNTFHDAKTPTCDFVSFSRDSQLLEHRRIRVAQRIVALDGVVVRLAEEDLGVAGIGKAVRVGQRDGAAERPVAGDGPVLAHERAPEEGHELLSTRGRRLGPEAPIRRLVFDDLLLPERRLEDVGIQAAKDLLRPRAVERDQDDGLPIGLGDAPRREGPESADGPKDCDALWREARCRRMQRLSHR